MADLAAAVAILLEQGDRQQQAKVLREVLVHLVLLVAVVAARVL
jgi:hypothetical protein